MTSGNHALLRTARRHEESRDTPRSAALPVLAPEYRLTGEAGGALDDLHHALLLAHERGQEIPCQGAGSAAWTSDDYDDQQVAADRCFDCPAMLLCERYRALAKPAAGTWAGVTSDRVMKPYVPKARRVGPLASERSDCLCGCGGQPRRGRYLPGHDSTHLRALRGGVLSGHMLPDEALADLAHSERLQAKLTRFLGGR